MNWDDRTIQWLRQLWGEGHTTPTIGRMMGVSKDTVIGKAHRLKLGARPSPIKYADPNAKRRKLARVTVRTNFGGDIEMAADDASRPAMAPAIPAMPIVLPFVIRSCCWPIGEPRTPGFRFCEATELVPGRPYCLDHCRIAYRCVGEAA